MVSLGAILLLYGVHLLMFHVFVYVKKILYIGANRLYKVPRVALEKFTTFQPSGCALGHEKVNFPRSTLVTL